MKGDFTRRTFRPEKRYTSVRMQQGRVQLDADWNEQVDIQQYRARKQAEDVIGPSGVPAEGPEGFEILLNGGRLSIQRGRIYVEGVLCELDDSVGLDAQPDLPGGTGNVAFPALVYLDVWERHVTALEDPTIIETALGGPDTATRTKTVWQAKLLHVEDVAAARALDLRGELLRPDGLLPIVAKTIPGQAPRGNHLYRVEIHDGVEDRATGAGVTFKWSRENGAAVAEWTGGSGRRITVRGRTRFAEGQFVELLDEAHELTGRPGVLCKIESVKDDAGGQELTLDQDVVATDFTPDRRKARRWDSRATAIMPMEGETLRGLTRVEEVPFTPLEGGGVEIALLFDGNATFSTGDAWVLPVRDGNVETTPLALAPFLFPLVFSSEEPHRFAKLAVIERDTLGNLRVVDLRAIFRSLTGLAGIREEIEILREKLEYTLVSTTQSQEHITAAGVFDHVLFNGSLVFHAFPIFTATHPSDIPPPGDRQWQIYIGPATLILTDLPPGGNAPAFPRAHDLVPYLYFNGDKVAVVAAYVKDESPTSSSSCCSIRELSGLASTSTVVGRYEVYEKTNPGMDDRFKAVFGFHGAGAHHIFMSTNGGKVLRASVPDDQAAGVLPATTDTGLATDPRGRNMAFYEVDAGPSAPRSFRIVTVDSSGDILLTPVAEDGRIAQSAAVRLGREERVSAVAGYFDGKYHHVIVAKNAPSELVEIWIADSPYDRPTRRPLQKAGVNSAINFVLARGGPRLAAQEIYFGVDPANAIKLLLPPGGR